MYVVNKSCELEKKFKYRVLVTILGTHFFEETQYLTSLFLPHLLPFVEDTDVNILFSLFVMLLVYLYKVPL